MGMNGVMDVGNMGGMGSMDMGNMDMGKMDMNNGKRMDMKDGKNMKDLKKGMKSSGSIDIRNGAVAHGM